MRKGSGVTRGYMYCRHLPDVSPITVDLYLQLVSSVLTGTNYIVFSLFRQGMILPF